MSATRNSLAGFSKELTLADFDAELRRLFDAFNELKLSTTFGDVDHINEKASGFLAEAEKFLAIWEEFDPDLSANIRDEMEKWIAVLSG